MNKKPRSPDSTQDHDPGEDLVSKSDIDSWAERERQRRRAWLEGPSDQERDDWASSERRRRRWRQRLPVVDEDDVAEGRRIADRWQRDAELILTGIAGRLVESPFSLLGYLAREGREFEDEFDVPRRRRRRASADDDT